MKVLTVDCRTLTNMCEFMLEGEPCFLIRAQDKVSIKALEQYHQLAFEAHGENLKEVREVRDRFREWQEQHPQRVKVPD